MLRITQLSGEYPPMRGGVADFTRLLSRELARQRHDVTVLTSRRVPVGAEHEVKVEARVDDWGIAAWREVRRHVDEDRPDILNVQYQTGAFGMKLGVNLLPWLLRARRPRPAFVVTFHDLKEPYILPKIGRARHLATVLLAAGADAVVVTNHEDFARAARWAELRAGGAAVSGRMELSKTILDQTRTGLHSWTRPLWGGRRLAAIPIGSNLPAVPADFDRSAARRALGVDDGDFVVAYFGFIVPSKGVEALVGAMERLIEGGRRARLLVVGASRGHTGRDGPDYEAEIRQRLSSEALRDHVMWTGYLEADAAARALAAADVAALPYRGGASLRHGTLMAALAQGLPIVSTSVGDQPAPLPVLRHGQNAVFVPPDDPAALAEALEQVASDPCLRALLAAGSRQLAAATDWAVIAEQTLGLYRRTLAAVL